MLRFPKPKVVASKCLGFQNCRWNGDTIPVKYIDEAKPHVNFITICPEVEIGLGVPRKPVRVIEHDDRLRLVQPDTRKDFTDKMTKFTGEYIESLYDIDGFILKGQSPSCGLKGVKIYSSATRTYPNRQRGAGLFASSIAEQFAYAAIEDEIRLRNFRVRENFYTKLFTLSRFRAIKASGATSELVHFHSAHKYLLTVYSPKQLKLLGKIVANPARKHFPDVIGEYQNHLHLALANIPRHGSHVNVLTHCLGYFKSDLDPGEKTHFLELLEQYRAKKIPLSACISVMKSWISRFDQPQLADQVYFEPYPWELATISDSGKGRAL